MKPSESLDSSIKQRIKGWCSLVKRKGIKLVAIDFDLTICAIHTGGGHVPENCLRPFFIELLEALDKEGVNYCVATFHSRESRVKDEIMNEANLSKEIIVRGANTETLPGSPKLGKSKQIFSAWSFDMMGQRLTGLPNATVLSSQGGTGIQFPVNSTSEEFMDILEENFSGNVGLEW
eukprot:CAMPEP_0184059012 /NCGR_PEP_ID=MMETSP0956-20121227/9701_1 /TAXON_ID=627963 /ORGANISM="Aplanochytrium sp, Strain PBS07" /LENGTH=176 /DNA_ID=CAMNT_0026354311 /DNA_START=39 /DNA_END=567 /DNA_ORIENTATION=-